MIDPLNLENESLNVEFDKQMQTLVDEAQASAGKPANAPVVSSLEIARFLEQNAKSIAQLEEIVREQGKSLNQKSALNQQLFDALHAELKGYRDNTILEVSQRPLITDVIGIYDELQRIFEQLQEAEKKGSSLATVKTSTDHLLHHVLEVLERVGVTKRDSLTGKYDINSHRAVLRVETAVREEDGSVDRSLRPGFYWRGSVLRPEEVAVKKWTKMAVSEQPDAAQPMQLEKEKL